MWSRDPVRFMVEGMVVPGSRMSYIFHKQALRSIPRPLKEYEKDDKVFHGQLEYRLAFIKRFANVVAELRV